MIVNYKSLPYGPAQACGVLQIVTNLSGDLSNFKEELQDALLEAKLTDTFNDMMLGKNPLSYIQVQDSEMNDVNDVINGYKTSIEVLSKWCIELFKEIPYQQEFFKEHSCYDLNKFIPVKFIYWGPAPKAYTKDLEELMTEFTLSYLEEPIIADPMKERVYDLFFDFTQSQFPNNSVILVHPNSEEEVSKVFTSYNEVLDLDNPVVRSRLVIVNDNQSNTEVNDAAIKAGLRPCVTLKGQELFNFKWS